MPKVSIENSRSQRWFIDSKITDIQKASEMGQRSLKTELAKMLLPTQVKMQFWEDQTVILIHTAVFPKVDSAILP